MKRGPRLLAVATACLSLLAVAALVAQQDEAPDPKDDSTALRAVDDGSQGTASDGSGNEGAATALASQGGSVVDTSVPGSTAIVGSNRASSASTSTTTTNGGPHYTATTTTQAPDGPKCPNPKTCDKYAFAEGPGTKGWRAEPDGTIRVRFHVNPTPPLNCGITADTVEAAYLRMTDVWETANPRVRFDYLGRTDRRPSHADGFTDFAVGSQADNTKDMYGYWVEADILQNAPGCPQAKLGWEPCGQREGSCGPAPSGLTQIEQLFVHELGHTLGLGDLRSTETEQLTMDTLSSGPPSSRYRVTLGLGDVLGLRALYPTSAPMPPIYSP